MSDAPGYIVRIERTFSAPAEAVFDAWTSAEVMRRPDGTRAAAHGEYRVIDRPRRLVMVWTFDDLPSNAQLIELTFSESEGATTVLMVNSGILSEPRRESQQLGWRECLNELERLLTG